MEFGKRKDEPCDSPLTLERVQVQRAVEKAVAKMRETHNLAGTIKIDPFDQRGLVDVKRLKITLKPNSPAKPYAEILRIIEGITAEQASLQQGIIAELAKQAGCSLDKFNLTRGSQLTGLSPLVFTIPEDPSQSITCDEDFLNLKFNIESELFPNSISKSPKPSPKDLGGGKGDEKRIRSSLERRPPEIYIIDHKKDKTFVPNPAKIRNKLLLDPVPTKPPHLGEYGDLTIPKAPKPTTGSFPIDTFGPAVVQTAEQIRKSFSERIEKFSVRAISFIIQIAQGQVTLVTPDFIGDATAQRTQSSDNVKKLEATLEQFGSDLRAAFNCSPQVRKVSSGRLNLTFALKPDSKELISVTTIGSLEYQPTSFGGFKV